MVYGIYQSAAGMQVNQYRQDVLANNLANLSTVGFKPEVAVVRERSVASREEMADPSTSDQVLSGMTGGTLVAPTYTSFAPGPVEQTNNPLDVALPDNGFFAVQDGSATRYTRDGRFTLNADGQLVTAAGRHPVLDVSGQPISLPSRAAAHARININGEVQSGAASFGRIGVVEFADPAQLTKVGGNLLDSNGAKAATSDAALHVGAVEQSAVDPTQAMVSMIEVSRAYQMNATMVQMADSTLGRAVNDIARLR
jgi:flagellar basal-body rod protein FlgF